MRVEQTSAATACAVLCVEDGHVPAPGGFFESVDEATLYRVEASRIISGLTLDGRLQEAETQSDQNIRVHVCLRISDACI